MLDIKGKTFCITGGLLNFDTKKQAWGQIARVGGYATDSLTYRCDYLIIGGKGSKSYIGNKGNKQLKAEQMQKEKHLIQILSENQFIELLENSPEVSADQRGAIFENGFSHAVEKNTIDIDGKELEITEQYLPAQHEVIQFLRIIYQSNPDYANESDCNNVIDKFITLKSMLSDLKLRCALYEDILPGSFWVEGKPPEIDNTIDTKSDKLFLHIKFVVLFTSDKEKQFARELSQQVKQFFVHNKYSGMLSFRLWDEKSNFGSFWVPKLLSSKYNPGG